MKISQLSLFLVILIVVFTIVEARKQRPTKSVKAKETEKDLCDYPTCICEYIHNQCPGSNPYVCSSIKSCSLDTNKPCCKSFQSCSQLKAQFPQVQSGFYKINPTDDSNAAFDAYCDMTSEGGIGVTVIGHNSEERTKVEGYEAPGSYSKEVVYTTSYANLAALADLSTHCKQFIKYDCHGAMLLADGDSWWVSRNGDRMDYWGGATGHPGKCACGVTNSCAGSNYCNCDKNDQTMRQDEGYLTDKATLPVKELRFGDTGGNYGVEYGYYTLGKLECWG